MKKLLFFITIAILAIPILARADGGIFPPPDNWMVETDQKAVIFYNQGLETLIVSITFKGDAEDFGWVMPTPSKPEVDKSSPELFTSLEELTQAEESALPGVPLGLEDRKGIEILEKKKVDIYDITVLQAASEEALTEWLSSNGYHFPESAGYILESYITNQWYFTCAKIRPEIITQTTEEQLRGGQATPLKLVFSSDQIVYPLKISSVMQYQEPIYRIMEEESTEKKLVMPPRELYTSVLLYTLADQEKDLPGFTTQYTQDISQAKIESLAFNDDGTPWIDVEEDYFLTKLYRRMKVSDMTSDLYLRNAQAEQAEPEEMVPEIPGWQMWFKNLLYILFGFFVWIISPIGLIFIIASLVQFMSKSKIAHIISWIFQGLSVFSSLIAILVLAGIYYGIFRESLFPVGKKIAHAGMWGGLVAIIVMGVVIIWQILYQRKHRTEL